MKKKMMKNKMMWIGLGGFLAAALLGGGVYLFVRRQNQQNQMMPAMQRPVEQMGAPAPESKKELKREVRILEDEQNRTFDM